MLDDGSHVSTASQSALDKPDFVGTVTVGVGVAGVVSDAARACGSVLGTAVRDDDAFIQVRVQGASYDTFIATLDDVTGKDYCLSRTDVSGVPGGRACLSCLSRWWLSIGVLVALKCPPQPRVNSGQCVFVLQDGGATMQPGYWRPPAVRHR
jgi:hypothetical protein